MVKKVTKKKKEKKKVELCYKFINKEGEDIYLKPIVYNKISSNHSSQLLLKKDKELFEAQKKIKAYELLSIQDKYNKEQVKLNGLIEEINKKIEINKEKHKQTLKCIQNELGDENQAFSIVDEDTYKILLET